MLLRKLWNHYAYDLPLQIKLLILNGLVLLIIGMVAMITFFQTSRLVQETTINAENTLVSQKAHTLNASVEAISKVMDSVCTAPFLSEMIYTDNMKGFIQKENTKDAKDEFVSSVNALLDDDLITNVVIYLNPRYETFYKDAETEDLFQSASRIKSAYWHGIFQGLPDCSELFCPDFYLTRYEKDNYGTLAYIRRIVRSSLRTEKEPDAYIAVYFSREQVETLLKSNQNSEGSVYYLINSRNNMAGTTDADLSGLYYLDYTALQEKLGDGSVFTENVILNTRLYMTYRDIEGTDWRLAAMIPRDSVSSSEEVIFRNFWMIFVWICCLILIAEFFITTSLSGRIHRITEQLHQHMEPAAAPSQLHSKAGRDEIGQLVRAYNDRVDEISSLLQEQAQNAEYMRMTEVKALQAQINPHFLYNMLDMINWLALSGSREQVSKAVISLSRFYRLALSKKELLVSIEEELRHVELYAELQNMRFNNSINFVIDVPDELLEYSIPKLVLQPIVENAILHGICEKENKKGDIVIMAWVQPSADRDSRNPAREDVVITVTDDGIGIPEDKLKTLLNPGKNPQAYSGSGSNIAIYNTHQRLKLLYGEGYGLSFASEPGSGTSVEVCFPAVKK